MSDKHPIIAITGSSGAGTTVIRKSFEQLFKEEKINAAFVEGDSFHRYERDEMLQIVDAWERTAGRGVSHFGPEANIFEKMELLFRQYSQTGIGEIRSYLHNETIAAKYGQRPGTFTNWKQIEGETDLLFYEGLHGGMVTEEINIVKYVDLLIGITPIINLEWIQKIHRDSTLRGYSINDVTRTILRRMDDYVTYIVPQFSRTHINFQRVPKVDTSNPFALEEIPTDKDCFYVIRFAYPKPKECQNLVRKLEGAFLSKNDTLVIPGEIYEDAIKLILTKKIKKIISQGRKLRKVKENKLI